MKKALKITGCVILGIIVLSVIANTCSDKEPSADTSSTEVTQSKEVTTWEYSENIDQMDNTKTKTAYLASDNSIKFDFPYGDSDFALCIRNWKGTTNVYLKGSNCQFIAGVLGEKTYRVKFDDEAPINVAVSYSSSGSHDMVFFSSEQKLISKLKSAKKVIIEAEFFRVGYKQIFFSTQGLNWE